MPNTYETKLWGGRFRGDEDAQKGIEELSLDELLQFSPAFGPDIFSYIDYAAILQKGIKKEML